MTPSDTSIESRLKLAISEILQSVPKQETRAASSSLSLAYRQDQASRIADSHSDAMFLAYLGTRLPATFAVVKHVLQEYLDLGGIPPHSLLDLGAGPATASFAALDLFDALSQLTLVEKEKRFERLGIRLSEIAHVDQVTKGSWHIKDLNQISIMPKTDLAIASYSLGEIPLSAAKEVATKAYLSASSAFIVIEPGSPKGFNLIRELRSHLTGVGAHIAAPCPHQKPCPMTGADFCHFSKRLTREKFHREAKNASLPYEDEKFSYAIFTKEPTHAYFGRLIKKPIKSSGHVTLDICHDGQIVRQVIGRSNKERYRPARKAEWGDLVES